MVKFALPKNSKINPGKYYRNSNSSKNLKKFKVYRWNPEDGKNPSIDTFEVNLIRLWSNGFGCFNQDKKRN